MSFICVPVGSISGGVGAQTRKCQQSTLPSALSIVRTFHIPLLDLSPWQHGSCRSCAATSSFPAHSWAVEEILWNLVLIGASLSSQGCLGKLLEWENRRKCGCNPAPCIPSTLPGHSAGSQVLKGELAMQPMPLLCIQNGHSKQRAYRSWQLTAPKA